MRQGKQTFPKNKLSTNGAKQQAELQRAADGQSKSYEQLQCTHGSINMEIHFMTNSAIRQRK